MNNTLRILIMAALFILLVSPVDFMPGPVDDILYIIGMFFIGRPKADAVE